MDYKEVARSLDIALQSCIIVVAIILLLFLETFVFPLALFAVA